MFDTLLTESRSTTIRQVAPKTLIHLHIPKTGGTTLSILLRGRGDECRALIAFVKDRPGTRPALRRLRRQVVPGICVSRHPLAEGLGRTIDWYLAMKTGSERCNPAPITIGSSCNTAWGRARS